MKWKLNIILILTVTILLFPYYLISENGDDFNKEVKLQVKRYKEKAKEYKKELRSAESETEKLRKEIRAIHKELCTKSRELYAVYEKLSVSKGRN